MASEKDLDEISLLYSSMGKERRLAVWLHTHWPYWGALDVLHDETWVTPMWLAQKDPCMPFCPMMDRLWAS